jgi:hypothetical protein
MTRAHGRWLIGGLLALALGLSACGGEEEGYAADPAVVIDPTPTTPGQPPELAQSRLWAEFPDQPDPEVVGIDNPGARVVQVPVPPDPDIVGIDNPGARLAEFPDPPDPDVVGIESPGTRVGVNWHPNPPPCRDCPVAPPGPVTVDPAPVPQARPR